MMKFFLLSIRIYIATVFMVCMTVANAAAYPEKPITLIVPFAPGGGTDSIARDLAKILSDKLGQAVVVENRGGGGGSIAASMGSKAEADGYTLLFVTSTFITHAATESTAGYNVEKDFAPVAMIGRGPLLVVTNKSVSAKSLSELIQLSNQSTEGLNYCSAGPGSINHLSGELFKQKIKEGVKIRVVTKGPASQANFKASATAGIKHLLEMKVIVDLRKDIHQKIIFIDDEVLWFGSLNVLSYTGETDETILRIYGPTICNSMAKHQLYKY